MAPPPPEGDGGTPKGGTSIAFAEGRKAMRTKRANMVQRANARRVAKKDGSHETRDMGDASPSAGEVEGSS